MFFIFISETDSFDLMISLESRMGERIPSFSEPFPLTSLLLRSNYSEHSSELSVRVKIFRKPPVWAPLWLETGGWGSIRHTPSQCTAINRADITIHLTSGQVRSGKEGWGQSKTQSSFYWQIITRPADTPSQVSSTESCFDFLPFNQKSNLDWLAKHPASGWWQSDKNWGPPGAK